MFVLHRSSCLWNGVTTAQLDEVFQVIKLEIVFVTVHEKVAPILTVHEKFYQSRYRGRERIGGDLVKVLME